MRLVASLVLFGSLLGAQSLPASGSVAVSGSFSEPVPVPLLAHDERVVGVAYGEWPGCKLPGGSGSTAPFLTANAIEFEVAGYPKAPGIQLLLQDVADPSQSMALSTARNPGGIWSTRRWPLPRAWQHRLVRVVVNDRNPVAADHWIGFTLPREAKVLSSQRFKSAGYAVFMLVAEWLLLVLPGAALAVWFSRKRGVLAPITVMLLLIGCGIGGFACFFAYVISPTIGKLFSLSVLLGSVFLLAIYRQQVVALFRGTTGKICLVWLLAAFLYTSGGFLYNNDDGPGEQIQDRFFPNQLPPDNLLPLILGERIYHNLPFRPAFFADIQSSDRPPLQTGIMLQQRPFWTSPDLQYVILGILLQTSWIPALWVFLRRLSINGPMLLAALAVPVLSCFAFTHDIFTWPKLLSAAYGLLALSCFGWLTGRQSNRLDAVLGGASTALAMLSHSGVMMTIIGFAFLTLILRKAPLRWSIMFLGVTAALFLPWSLYQKLYDPPGDALLKLHLAGVIDRNRSLSSLIMASYTNLGFMGWITTKWINVKTLFWGTSGAKLFHGASQTVLGFSELTFFNLFPCIGLANIGFALRFGGRGRERQIADRMLLVSFASLVAWLLIMFAPESTTIHQGSFVTVLLLLSALAILTFGYHKRAGLALVLLQLTLFLSYVVLAKPIIENQPSALMDTFPDIGMFLLFAASFTSLIFLVTQEWRKGGALSSARPCPFDVQSAVE